MSDKVIVLGGGVAGMSAAHELVEAGFEVDVYESKSIPGGKARSVAVPDSSAGDRKSLPGEHGFRFFPRFYKHITDTMRRIPYGDNRQGVYDNLVDTTRIQMARYGQPHVNLVSRCPRSLTDFKQIFTDLFDTDIGVSDDDIQFFGEKVWQIMTSCEERRLDEYEKIGWWDFIGAPSRSQAYQHLFGYGLTRSLVAAKANLASTKTVGDIFVQLLFDVLEPGVSSDRVLNGPTNKVWIEPWLDYLRLKGVRYHLDAQVMSINCKGEVITGVTINESGVVSEKTGDYYISALPVEVMSGLINDDLLQADPSLANIKTLAPNVSWMNGIQFYLTEDVEVVHGHVLYIDAPWALTSVSQHQFWRDVDLTEYGDGKVKGILSVDVSEWTRPGISGKTAMQCTRDEIKDEIWAQLKMSLNVDGKEELTDEHLHSWFLDPDIVFFKDPHDPDPTKKDNKEPLLVNLVDTWHLRPCAFTRIPNLFLASDYVQTFTDLATMEGANEAARRAVNCIIDASGSRAAYCAIWKLHEPEVFEPWRAHDRSRWQKGLPWNGKMWN